MTKLIAEIGWNHMGDMTLAKDMIWAAKESGCDFAKFQTWSVDRLKPGVWDTDGRREIYEKAELDLDKHLDLVLRESDVISLHVHVNDETRHMIDKKTLGIMKNNSYIVNTSRGEIVNEQDIIESLKSGKLKGYATDVIEDEYGNRYKSPILNGVKKGLNILVTPHIGGMTWEGQQKAYMWSISKLKELK